MGMQKFCKFIFKDVKINEYVAMADVVVLPYPTLIGTEGNPSCLLESMASKTLVVTTALPELNEVFGNYVIMAKPRDLDSLVKKINLSLNKSHKKMIEKAYKKSKEFGIEVITKQFLDLYSFTYISKIDYIFYYV